MIHDPSLWQDIVATLTHPLKGRGYQFWSGLGGDVAVFSLLTAFILKHNCYEHGCPRIARVLGDDGHRRCRKHHCAP